MEPFMRASLLHQEVCGGKKEEILVAEVEAEVKKDLKYLLQM